MMKKYLLSIAGVALLGTAWAVGELSVSETESTAPSAYGFLISDDSGRDVGLYTFPVTSASSPTLVAKSEDVSAGAMGADAYYAATYTTGSPAIPKAWNKVDLATGTFTKLADFGEGAPLYVDLTYDYTRGKLLGLYHHSGNSSSVVEVNPSDGSVVSTYVEMPMMWMIGIAANYEGDIYLIGRGTTMTYYLYSLDDGRRLSTVGQVASMADYMQSMEFDRKTGKLYWAGTSQYDAYIYEVNVSTGACSALTPIGKNGEITGMYIPFSLAPDGTPGAASGFSVDNHSHDGNVELTFTVPVATADGKELASVSGWKIMCDETVLDIPFESVAPGTSVSVNAVVEQGMHLFKVIFINEIGEGVPANCKMYVGVDTPAVPVGVAVTSEGNKAVVSWDAVVTGANGGWIDAAGVTYNVVRNPDGKEVAKGISATTVTDEVAEMNAYQYMVTAVVGGKEGQPGISDMVAVGEGMTLPYICSFTQPQDLVLWTSVDVNADGYSWQYASNYGNPAMLARSTFSYECDEWLISPALKLEAGKEYKIAYDAGAMNMTYPPSYTLAMGVDASPEALDKELYSGSPEGMYPTRSIVYLPEVAESGTYHIGLHAKWAKGYPALYFGNVKVEENHAARLALTVVDADNKPVEGATVTFGVDGDKYTTDAEGKTSIIEIDPGTYDVTVEKYGHITEKVSLTFAANEDKHQSLTLKNIPVTTVSGVVKYATGKPMGDASIYVNGYKDYTAVTAADGSFTVEGVYVTGDYSVEAHALNYLPGVVSVKGITAEPVNVGDIVLQEKLTAPAAVKHVYDRQKVDLTWEAPVDKEETMRYDDGQSGMINSYSMSPNISYNTVTGVAYDTPGVYTGMSFKADNYKDIGIVVFDLDENGEPTTDILYEQTVKGDSWNWVDVTFSHPVVAPRGALFALRGDSRLYFDGQTDGSRNEAYPVKSDKMWLSYDYTSAETPFHWQMNDGSGPLFMYNFCLRAVGRLMGAPRKVSRSADAAAPVVGYHVWRIPDGSETTQADWVQLTSAPVAEASYTDDSWSTAAKGLYRYAVKALYTGDELSYPVFSNVVPRQLTSPVDLTLLTNAPGESAAGAAALLVEKDGVHSYNAVADSDGNVHFDNVWEGTYLLTVTCEGFAALSEELTVNGDTDFTATYTLTENVSMPFNIVADETGDDTSRLLRWNFKEFIFDDFESYADFTVHPSGEIGWTYIDADGIDDVGIQNTRYPGIDAAAFVVLNDATSDNPRYTSAHSGERVIVSMPSYNDKAPADDYIVSPELNFKGDFVVNFWAHTYWTRNDYYRVGYSSTSNSLDDFVWTDNVAVPDDKWINPTVNIPAGTKYVAINYGSAFKAGAIDDIYIGPAESIPGVTAKMPQRVAGAPVRYEVYLDGVKKGETQANEWLLEGLTAGEHTAGVKSVFASAVSEMAVVSFTVSTSGIVENISEELRIVSSNGAITVHGVGAADQVALYDVAGRSCPLSRSADVVAASGLAAGKVYVLLVNGRTYRIML
ncbi:carboxypeptidase regulatory-like domain-containing protein [uncultured Muribaculum sp.]|uniref:carboxypeptidase regulatory-like domain-containing protein n=1 Tax=uncultured Muribaculum sp. TaxID=1918613 RepID=UPI0025F7808E|nr:carboxypeptidase regulatory-like domain-containing protein [uncultured Muribaculum sp.]